MNCSTHKRHKLEERTRKTSCDHCGNSEEYTEHFCSICEKRMEKERAKKRVDDYKNNSIISDKYKEPYDGF
jgi:hypothetical protein